MASPLLPIFICSLVLVLGIKLFVASRKQHKNLPPCPLALPIIGHLHLLKQPIHQTFHNFSQTYGSVMSLKLGSQLAIVVSSLSAAEECFTKNDIIFANRPRFQMGKYLTYNSTIMGAANYGDHWRNLRRLSAIEIFSSARLNLFSNMRRDEVRRLLCRLSRVSSSGFAKVELRPMFFDLTVNVIMRMVAGKQFYGEEVGDSEEARQFRELMAEYLECAGKASIGDFIPILKMVDIYNGSVKKAIRVSKKFDEFLQRLIEEHRVDKDRNTLVNLMLNLQESEPEYYTDEIIKGLVLVLLLGGAETTATSLEWAISNLLNHPKVLEKAKEELDTQIGQHHLINESDLSKLQYLQNIISENLRLCPIAPLLAPHFSSDECTVGGYRVPSGTVLFVNVWAIHRDPNLWDDPTRFKPERFEDKEKTEGTAGLAFGMGRRICPGESMAKRVLGLTLGSLIQSFDWERVGEEEIDMAQQLNVTMSKIEPLVVMCRSRPDLQLLLSQLDY